MKLLLTLLFFSLGLMAQTISTGPQQNYKNVIQITNNTVPSLTNPNPSGGTYGKFVQAYYVFSGPCIHTAGIKTISITAGGTGYVTGNHVTINGGSPLATYSVTAGSGVVTGLTLVNPTFATPYGGGYSTGSGQATTAVTGSGTGLTVNITALQTATAGPNCVIVLDMDKNAGYAVAAAESVTFTAVDPASTGINGTFPTVYSIPFHLYSFSIATAGSGQTGGFYFINPTGGGGGSGNQQAINIPSSGAGAGTVTRVLSAWYGSGYTSCPTLTVGAGGTPATFNCVDSAYPSWTFDTSLSAGTSYYQLGTGNVGGGIAQDNLGNTWSTYGSNYANQLNQGVSYMSIRKSTDGGHTWGTENPFLYDGFPGAFAMHCGPGGNTLPCSYVTGGIAVAPNGKLTIPYWYEDPSGNYFLNFGSATFCCYVIQCDPSAVDCTQISNWSSPYQIPITVSPLVSPNGQPYLYDSLFVTSSFGPGGEMGLGLADASGFGYAVPSCDDGATWGTGTGCPGGTVLLQQIKDSAGTPGLNGVLPTIEFAVGYIGSNTYVMFGRNNIENFSGGTGSCTVPQVVCGPPIFGYSNNGGTTWFLFQSHLTPFIGPITTGEYGEAGMSLMDTGHVASGGVDYWTVMFIERDQTPGANLYVIASTINPATLVASPTSWTNSNLQSLWYYTVNPEPSSPWQTMTGSLTTAFSWAAGPGNNLLDSFWSSYATYTFPVPVGMTLIGIKGTGMKGTGVQ